MTVIALKGRDGVLITSDKGRTIVKGEDHMYWIGASELKRGFPFLDNYDAVGYDDLSLDECLRNGKVPVKFFDEMIEAKIEFVWVTSYNSEFRLYEANKKLEVTDRTNEGIAKAGKYNKLKIPNTNFTRLTIDDLSYFVENMFKKFKSRQTEYLV